MFNQNLCLHGGSKSKCTYCEEIQNKSVGELAYEYVAGNKIIERLFYLKAWYEQNETMSRHLGNEIQA